MIVGIIGSGGREHAICTMLKNSKKVSQLYCFPGKQYILLIFFDLFNDEQIACSLPPLPIIPTIMYKHINYK